MLGISEKEKLLLPHFLDKTHERKLKIASNQILWITVVKGMPLNGFPVPGKDSTG